MTITYLSEEVNKYLKIVGTEVASFITDIADYVDVTVTGIKTCGTPVILTLDTTEILSDESLFYVEDDVLYINPLFFGLTDYTDGIYNITIKFNKGDEEGYVLTSNCIFVDVTYKCKVAALLQNIIKENEKGNNEKISTIIHILHYSLSNGSNCGCNCTELCTVFNELTDLLTNIDTQILNDCGC